ncbi:MAG TPA: DUF2299 family protein [Thermoplasmata archaeon]|nr:DUF2299 family protein [Thermoplasmata archaeon]
MPANGGDALEARLTRWLDEEGLTHRRVDVQGMRFALEVKSHTGLTYNVGQQVPPSDAIAISGSIILPDKFKNTFERAPKRKRLLFLQDLRFDLLLAGHTFGFNPPTGTPNQIVVGAQVWEDGLTKDSFMRAMQQVVNGLVLVVWSVDEGTSYLTSARKSRRKRPTG